VENLGVNNKNDLEMELTWERGMCKQSILFLIRENRIQSDFVVLNIEHYLYGLADFNTS